MKKSYSCEVLENGIHFLPDAIKYCCGFSKAPGINMTEFKTLPIDEISTKRKELINSFKKGIIPEECSQCTEFKEREKRNNNIFSFLFGYKKEVPLIKNIIINHFKQCELNCVYCSQKIIYKEYTQEYQVLPLLKQLYKKGVIDKNNLKVEFQGGNISMLNEFDDIIDLLIENNCKEYMINTNLVKNLETFNKIPKDKIIDFVISLDCGKKETFKNIKGVDRFDEVLANLKEISTMKNAEIDLKYIIVEGLNDNWEELKQFLIIAKGLKNLACVHLEIDFRNTLMANVKDFVVPKHYYEMIDNAKKFAKEEKITFCVNPYSLKILEKGSV